MRVNLSLAFEKWKSYISLYRDMKGFRKKVISVKNSDKGSYDLDKFNGKTDHPKTELD